MASLGDRDGWDLLGIADTPGNAMDVWVALALAAERTARVPLSACVTNLVTRHPSVTAGAAVSVDALSTGRLILGLGTGHSGVANVGAAASSPDDFRRGLADVRGRLAESAAGTRRVPVYAAASGPSALRAAGAVADGVFVNYGLGPEHVARARALIAEGARQSGRSLDDVDVWWIACLDVSESRDVALEQLGNILGFVGAYVAGPHPERRDVPPALVEPMRELRRTYTTRRAQMDPALTRRLGVFDYLRARLAIAGTPEDCVEQVRAALEAGARSLMFTVSLASDPVRTVELFGREVLGRLKGVQRPTPA
jgi:5,10-methylenetetrahydromethanopterin reductase